MSFSSGGLTFPLTFPLTFGSATPTAATPILATPAPPYNRDRTAFNPRKAVGATVGGGLTLVDAYLVVTHMTPTVGGLLFVGGVGGLVLYRRYGDE